jgi:hypothetical protein
MNRNDFDHICKLLEQVLASLSPDKAYLIESRLLPVAREWKSRPRRLSGPARQCAAGPCATSSTR